MNRFWLCALLDATFCCVVPDARADDNMPGDHILFQGDSITDGNRGRSEDPNPIYSGHQIMADEWERTVGSFHGSFFAQ